MASSVQQFSLLHTPPAGKSRSSLQPAPLLTQFFAGPENRLAAFVCTSGESLLDRGNPLLLVGPSGSGKTSLAFHLLAKEASLRTKPRTLSLTAVDFARRYAEAVDRDDMDHFRLPVDECDVLFIDDVHLIADKHPAQVELATRLARREETGRVTILTCRRLPTEIRSFHGSLASRMLPGLTLPLALPGTETRHAVLRQLANDARFDLPDDLRNLLVAGLPADLPVTRLAAALTHVRVWCENAASPANVFAIQLAIDSTAAQHEPPLADIAQAVARRFRLKTSDLKGPTRKQQVVRARALAMYLMRKLTERSLHQIGEFFGGRDHTTVLHACRKTEASLPETPELLRIIDELTESLRKTVKLA